MDTLIVGAGFAGATTARVLAGDDHNDCTQRFQATPAYDDTRMLERPLDRPGTVVRTPNACEDIGPEVDGRRTVFSVPSNAQYGRHFGRLPCRSLRFEHEHLPRCAQPQTVSTVTDPTVPAVTRIPEFKPLTGHTHTSTSYLREKTTAEVETQFIGRLSPYRCYSIDLVAAAALA